MTRTATVHKVWVIFFVLSLCVIFLPRPAQAEDSDLTVRYATVADFHGQVEMRRLNDETWSPASKDVQLFEGDSLRTSQGSSVDLKIIGGEVSEVRLMENTEMTFDKLHFDQGSELTDTLLSLAIGKILVTSEDLTPGSDYNVQTPTSLVGIRGTMFEVEVS